MNIFRLLAWGIIWSLGMTTSPAQTNRFRVMEYNTENLFDCRHDTLKDDLAYLPEATRHWTPYRLHNKLLKLGRLIAAVGKEQAPDLIALCEVENDSVLIKLTQHTPLRTLDYRFIITHSPDERGIDVALLYQRARFRVLSHHSIPVPLPSGERPTRDLLHVSGRIATGDTLDVIVCHLPSRITGARRGRLRRQRAAEVLKRYCDSLMHVRRAPRLLVTGDFNDTPEGDVVQGVMQAGAPDNTPSPHRLYNLMAGKRPGTYRYRGEWSTIDHLLVSGLLLDESAGFHTRSDAATIVTFPYLLEKEKRYGGLRPARTYNGMRYNGGYSDHLPIRADFFLSQ